MQGIDLVGKLQPENYHKGWKNMDNKDVNIFFVSTLVHQTLNPLQAVPKNQGKRKS